MRLECHVHTRYSKDSLLPLWLLYFKCIIKHIDIVAITDHNTIEGAEKFKNRFDRNSRHKYPFISGLCVIIGSEIMTTEGEIIGLFLNKDIQEGKSADETIESIKSQGGVVYLPHPYDLKRQKTVLTAAAIRRLHNKIDCAECYNGRNISPEYEKKQTEIVKKYNFIPVIGSDAHTFIEVGRNYMTIPNKRINDKASFLEIIKLQRPHKAKCIKFAHDITKFAKLVRMIERGEWGELYRIIIERIK